MASRLYMVRRALEHYIGPMTSQEFVAALRRFEFGPSDEVCASLGAWIKIENASRLKRHYPEIAKIVDANIRDNWSFNSDADGKDISVAAKPSKKPRPKVRRSKTLNSIIIALLASILLLSFALIKSGKFAGKAPADQQLDALAAFLAQGEYDGHAKAMEELMPSVLNKWRSAKRIPSDWIVHLRSLAFQRNGSVDGLTPKQIAAGEQWPVNLPDCQLATWQDLWRGQTPGIPDLLAGRSTTAVLALGILFWDPTWLVWHSKSSNWQNPANIYAFCLGISRRAMENVVVGKEGDEIKARLDFLVSATSGTLRSDAYQYSSPIFQALRCHEQLLDNCEALTSSMDSQWKTWLATARKRQDAFAIMKKQGDLTGEDLDALTKLMTGLPVKDPFSLLNYQAEFNFSDALKQAKGVRKDALTLIRNEFQNVKFGE